MNILDLRLERPIWLALLLILPAAVFLYRAALVRRDRGALLFSAVDMLVTISRPPSRKRHLPIAAALLSAICLIIGIAEPQAQGSVKSQRKTVIMVVDISRSMGATDVAPTRLEAATAAGLRFVDRIPGGYEIGLVVFSGVARVKSTPTLDRDRIRKGMQGLTVENGTATGDALVLALSQFGESTRGGVVVLLSDGRQTAGTTTVEGAAGALKAAGVTVYSIALGTAEGQLSELDEASGGITLVSVPPDPAGLSTLTTITGGKTFEAVTVDGLNEIYDSVGGQLSTQAGWVGVGWVFSLASLLCLVLAGLSARRWSILR
jgi:Ca-activated chloride channel family protein